jgi:hypothetical protein
MVNSWEQRAPSLYEKSADMRAFAKSDMSADETRRFFLAVNRLNLYAGLECSWVERTGVVVGDPELFLSVLNGRLHPWVRGCVRAFD